MTVSFATDLNYNMTVRKCVVTLCMYAYSCYFCVTWTTLHVFLFLMSLAAGKSILERGGLARRCQQPNLPEFLKKKSLLQEGPKLSGDRDAEGTTAPFACPYPCSSESSVIGKISDVNILGSVSLPVCDEKRIKTPTKPVKPCQTDRKKHKMAAKDWTSTSTKNGGKKCGH